MHPYAHSEGCIAAKAEAAEAAEANPAKIIGRQHPCQISVKPRCIYVKSKLSKERVCAKGPGSIGTINQNMINISMTGSKIDK